MNDFMVNLKENAIKLLILVNRWCRSLGLNLPLSHPMDYFSQEFVIQFVIMCQWRGDLAYEISSLEV